MLFWYPPIEQQSTSEMFQAHYLLSIKQNKTDPGLGTSETQKSFNSAQRIIFKAEGNLRGFTV